MKVVDALILTPVAVSLFIGIDVWRRGRTHADDPVTPISATGGAEALDPRFGIAMIGLLVLSGAVLLAREIYREARDARNEDDAKR